VKNQCSGDYFYGEELRLERAFQPFEGLYANTIKQFSVKNFKADEGQCAFLRKFWCLQYLRTEAASIRAVQMAEEAKEVAGISVDKFKPSIKDAVQQAMRAFAKAHPVVDDMKVCFFLNRTQLPFITSDDPAVMTNWLYLQKQKLFTVAPGLSGAGAILLLPITPQILFMAYDGDIYTVPNANGCVEITKAEDVTALNAHQFMNCRANVYFEDWEDRELVERAFNAVV